jgi:hypothetical protein
VRSFGVQGDRIGPQAATGLDQRKTEQQSEGDPQAPLARLVGAMDVPMSVCVSMTMSMIMIMAMSVVMIVVGMLIHSGLFYNK